jgi:hypothetical protein
MFNDDLDLSADMITVETICERYEELRDERVALEEALEEAQEAYDDLDEDTTEEEREEVTNTLAAARLDLAKSDENTEDKEEREMLGALLKSLCGYGGNHQWEGDWYPDTLIDRTYFVEYCKDLVSDIGDLPEIPSYLAIDWEQTAKNLEVDYSTVDVDGREYLYR